MKFEDGCILVDGPGAPLSDTEDSCDPCGAHLTPTMTDYSSGKRICEVIELRKEHLEEYKRVCYETPTQRTEN